MNKRDVVTIMDKLHEKYALPRRDYYAVLCPDEASANDLRGLLAAAGTQDSFKLTVMNNRASAPGVDQTQR